MSEKELEDIESLIAEKLELTGSVHDQGTVVVEIENLFLVENEEEADLE